MCWLTRVGSAVAAIEARRTRCPARRLPVGELVHEAGLAHAAEPGDRHDPVAVDRPPEVRQLRFATHERGRLGVVGGPGGQLRQRGVVLEHGDLEPTELGAGLEAQLLAEVAPGLVVGPAARRPAGRSGRAWS